MVERKKLISMVRGAQQGDDEAAAELYDVFYSDIYYHIMKTVNDPELAADLTQDTFIEILATIGKLEEPAAFVTWAKQIAYHRCTAYFRKSHELLADEDEDGYSVFDTIEEDRDEFIPGEALDKEDLKKAIHDMINDLPPEQRSALLMRYFEEVSVKEIAEIQGVTEGTVKSRLNYARKAVKQSVEEYEKKHDIKLHSVGILPLLLWLFGQYQKAGFSFGAGAAATATGATAAGATATGTGTATATGATAATATTAGTTTAGAATATGAAATAASTASTAAAVGVAGATAGTASTAGTAAAVGTALATKIVAGIVAVAVAVGGATTAVVISKNSAEQASPTVSTVQTVPSETVVDEQIEELKFALSKDGASYEVTGIGTFKGTELVIPAEYNGVPVKAIQEQAFYECKQLTSVSIPGSVESIGGRAFQLCENIKSLTLSEGIQRIEGGAFSKCYALTSIHIPASVTYIGSFAFDMCFGAEQITVATDNAVYHSSGNCLIDTAEKSIIAACGNSVIPTDGSVDKISEGGFNGYDNETLVLPDCITSIGDSAFSGSTIKEVVIPGSVTTMGTYIFGGCTSLTTATFEEGVTGINSAAFSYCPSLHTVYIPVSTLYIDSSAFSLCEKLSDIYYAGTMAQWNSIWNIHQWFTVHCTDGDIMESSAENNNQEDNSFSDDTETEVIVGAEGMIFTLNDDGKGYTLTGLYESAGTTYIIPAAYEGLPVTAIDVNVFFCHPYLTNLTIPTSITENLEDISFFNCSNLKTLIVAEGNPTYHSVGNCIIETASKTLVVGCKTSVIPTDGSVTSIGQGAFCGCDSLTSITIPSGVVSIGNQAFDSCTSLSDITIPDSVTSIGDFAFSYCPSLSSVTISASVTSINQGVFLYCGNLEEIIVAEGNSVYHSSGNCLIETASKMLVVGCKTSVIPTDGSVNSIGVDAFCSCTSLSSITIPANVTSIASGAFNNCSDLEEIVVAEENPVYHSSGNCLIETASKTLVVGCKTSVIPTDGSVTSIGQGAFDSCDSLTSITIPEGVVSIGIQAFEGCTSLSDITIPDSVTSIGDFAFINCTSLSSVTIPASVTSIEQSALGFCYNLVDIYYTGTMEQWNAIEKDDEWDYYPGEYVIHCTDGDIPKS